MTNKPPQEPRTEHQHDYHLSYSFNEDLTPVYETYRCACGDYYHTQLVRSGLFRTKMIQVDTIHRNFKGKQV